MEAGSGTSVSQQCPRISPKFWPRKQRTIGEWWDREEYGCDFSWMPRARRSRATRLIVCSRRRWNMGAVVSSARLHRCLRHRPAVDPDGYCVYRALLFQTEKCTTADGQVEQAPVSLVRHPAATGTRYRTRQYAK